MAQDPWLQPEGPQVQFTTASDRLGRTPPRSGARGHLSTSRLRAHWVPLQLRSATACFPGKASQSLVPPFSPPCTPLGRWGQAGGRMKPQPTRAAAGFASRISDPRREDPPRAAPTSGSAWQVPGRARGRLSSAGAPLPASLRWGIALTGSHGAHFPGAARALLTLGRSSGRPRELLEGWTDHLATRPGGQAGGKEGGQMRVLVCQAVWAGR